MLYRKNGMIFAKDCRGGHRSFKNENNVLPLLKKAAIFGAALKHYCANTTEYERLKSNIRVSERALREICMKSFEIAVKKADPWAIMSSYNSVNDTKVCENRTLITEIPRKEWNWDGVFVTDRRNDSNHIKELKAGHVINRKKIGLIFEP